jgi:hypothetical protein
MDMKDSPARSRDANGVPAALPNTSAPKAGGSAAEDEEYNEEDKDTGIMSITDDDDVDDDEDDDEDSGNFSSPSRQSGCGWTEKEGGCKMITGSEEGAAATAANSDGRDMDIVGRASFSASNNENG